MTKPKRVHRIPNHNKGKGKAYAYILAHVGYDGDDCVPWPFAKDEHGRGLLGHNGERWRAHRLMCILAHGEPPTPEHTAAHECGKGHEGCINPKHLDWKTQAENLEDCRRHGTLIRHRGGNVRRLSPEQIQAIKDAKGSISQVKLGDTYGVCAATISDIWRGRIYIQPSKVKHWKPEEVGALREALAGGMSFPQAARHLGKSLSAVTGKTYQLGLTSGRPATRVYTRTTSPQ